MKGLPLLRGVQEDVADGGMVAVFKQDVRTVIRGAVVQEDELEIGEGLGQNRIDSLADISAVVVVGGR